MISAVKTNNRVQVLLGWEGELHRGSSKENSLKEMTFKLGSWRMERRKGVHHPKRKG